MFQGFNGTPLLRRYTKSDLPPLIPAFPPTLLEQVEADLIKDALEKTGWDRREAAQRLGLPLRTMAHKMRQHGIRIHFGRVDGDGIISWP